MLQPGRLRGYGFAQKGGCLLCRRLYVGGGGGVRLFEAGERAGELPVASWIRASFRGFLRRFAMLVYLVGGWDGDF